MSPPRVAGYNKYVFDPDRPNGRLNLTASAYRLFDCILCVAGIVCSVFYFLTLVSESSVVALNGRTFRNENAEVISPAFEHWCSLALSSQRLQSITAARNRN